MKSKALVLGASPNPSRYSWLATTRLNDAGYEVFPIGIKEGTIGNLNIIQGKPDLKDIDTVTLYMNPKNQQDYYDYILSLHPRRIIFNPGTENPELYEIAKQAGIETIEACTLVMLSTGQY